MPRKSLSSIRREIALEIFKSLLSTGTAVDAKGNMLSMDKLMELSIELADILIYKTQYNNDSTR